MCTHNFIPFIYITDSDFHSVIYIYIYIYIYICIYTHTCIHTHTILSLTQKELELNIFTVTTHYHFLETWINFSSFISKFLCRWNPFKSVKFMINLKSGWGLELFEWLSCMRTCGEWERRGGAIEKFHIFPFIIYWEELISYIINYTY